ncbi:MAG TPA: Fur family transcriptional regulator [Ktedonobacterales bacterium]|jgi:Fur family ferric uptake transcriptional regulator
MIERLAQAGFKLTLPRRRVVEALGGAGGPLTAQEVAERAGTGAASTYRVLGLLVALSMVSEVEDPHERAGVERGAQGGEGGPGGEARSRRYALCSLAEHHHHFVCRCCHATLDVASERLEGALHDLARRDGLEIERHEVTLLGRCRRCREVGAV